MRKRRNKKCKTKIIKEKGQMKKRSEKDHKRKMKKYFTSRKEECEMKENDGEEGK